MERGVARYAWTAAVCALLSGCFDSGSEEAECSAAAATCDPGAGGDDGDGSGGAVGAAGGRLGGAAAPASGVCGDGIQDPGEQCDGAALGGLSCAALGMGAGTLGCSAVCSFDTSLCNAVRWEGGASPGTPDPTSTPDAGTGTGAPDAGVSPGEVFDPCLICPGYDTACTQAGTYYQCFRPEGAPGDQCPRDESLTRCEPGYSCSYWSGVGCSANYCLCQDGDWRCTDHKCPESGDCNRLPGRDCDEVGASCDFDSLHCECTAADAGNATWSCRID